MPERLRTAVAFALLALSLPLWPVALPATALWARRERRRRRSSGYAVLWPSMARTLVAHAEAWIGSAPPPSGWGVYVRNVDRYLSLVRGPSVGLQVALLVAMEYAPLLTLRGRFSRLPLGTRRHLLARRYLVPGGLLSPLAWSRQLVRLGWHADPETRRRSGHAFRPEGRERRTLRARTATVAVA
ncbi:MAG: hypothetical protein JNM10_04900 [Planctomycetia bacterium]|nr:hypothetical protein [Planctomycetia bacterium]